MGKIKLNANLISKEENLIIDIYGIQRDNKIVYKENNITVTILVLNNKIEMNRICNEYEINLLFETNKSTKSTYKLFGSDKDFFLETITRKLKIENNIIEIEYKLEGNNYSYLLKIGE